MVPSMPRLERQSSGRLPSQAQSCAEAAAGPALVSPRAWAPTGSIHGTLDGKRRWEGQKMATIEELSDRLAIHDLMHTYARAVDGRDWELYRQVFTPQARIDYTDSGG